MIDTRLDQVLLEMNDRYQTLLCNALLDRRMRRKRYLDYMKSFHPVKFIRDLQYKKYASTHFSTSGNRVGSRGCGQDIEGLKIAVYSCIIGPYDQVIDPIVQEPEISYFMFTDQELPENSVWQKVDVTKLQEYEKESPVVQNRRIKILQSDWLKQFDYTVYVDGNIEIVAGISPLIAQMGHCGFGVHYHGSRDCIYDEAMAVRHWKKVSESALDKQMCQYRTEGYPRHIGLYENPILIRDNRDQATMDLMDAWWAEYCRYPTRDQLSLPYVIRKTEYDRQNIMIMGNDVTRNPRFNRMQHLCEKF